MDVDTILKNAMKAMPSLKVLSGIVALASVAMGAFQNNWRVALLGVLATLVFLGPAALLEKINSTDNKNSWRRKFALALVLLLSLVSVFLILLVGSSWGWDKPKPLCALLYFGCDTPSNEKLIRDAFKRKELGRSLSEGQYVSFSQQQFERGHMFWKARPWLKILVTQGSDTVVYDPKLAVASVTAAKLDEYGIDIKKYFYLDGGFARTWLEFSLGSPEKLGRPVSPTQSGIIWSQDFEVGTVVYPIPVWDADLGAFHPRDYQFILFERRNGVDTLKRNAASFAYNYRDE